MDTYIFRKITSMIESKDRDRDVKLGLYCKHLLPGYGGDIVNSDGRKVCGECCDHSNAWTGIRQWNGLTYCIHCCKHNFGHKNFVSYLGDGFDTCTLCFRVVGQHIGMPPCQRSKRVRKVRLVVPKIVLTDCGGVVRHVNKG